VNRIGKPEWRAMLAYVAELHVRSVHPAAHHWPHPWEEIGPGYCYGHAFGHWDIVHQAIDQLATYPENAANQLRNLLGGQQDDGFLPGAIYFNCARWFEATGTIWEFYDAEGGDPREVFRKPHTPFNRPSPDYLGHNPLLAMARLWEECQE
jgi:hypothetical protein